MEGRHDREAILHGGEHLLELRALARRQLELGEGVSADRLHASLFDRSVQDRDWMGPSGSSSVRCSNKCLALGANEQGLHISVPRIFAIGHPALFVPWSEIRASRKKQLWVPTVGFELGEASPIGLRMHQRFADGLESSARGQLQSTNDGR